MPNQETKCGCEVSILGEPTVLIPPLELSAAACLYPALKKRVDEAVREINNEIELAEVDGNNDRLSGLRFALRLLKE